MKKLIVFIAAHCLILNLAQAVDLLTPQPAIPVSRGFGMVPVVPSEKNVQVFQVGQVFYDLSSGGFKGINKDGKVDVLTNEKTTPPPPPVQVPTNLVSSPDSKGKMLSAAFINFDGNGNLTVEAQDGKWIESVTNSRPGNTVLNFVAGTFTSAPICFCTPVSGDNIMCKIESAPTTSGVNVTQLFKGSEANIPYAVLCIGSHS